MDLLFRREQTKGGTRVDFKLWAKVELDMQEESLMKRYDFDGAILIAVLQPELLKNSIWVTGLSSLALGSILWGKLGGVGVFFGFMVAVAFGLMYYDAHRETIYVRDLMHGRHFRCKSVIDLAKKEAWLSVVVSYLRQVMESAKHWDGTEQHHVDPLPKEEAKLVMLRGL